MITGNEKSMFLKFIGGAAKTCGVCIAAYFLIILFNMISDKHESKEPANRDAPKMKSRMNRKKNKIKASKKNIEMSQTRNEIVKKIKKQNSADRQ